MLVHYHKVVSSSCISVAIYSLTFLRYLTSQLVVKAVYMTYVRVPIFPFHKTQVALEKAKENKCDVAV